MTVNKETSDKQLNKLLKQLKIDNFIIIRKNQLPSLLKQDAAQRASISKNLPKFNNFIINFDSKGPGTHWVALNKEHKLYFDPYGQAPPIEIPKDYKFSHNIIEGINDQDCGQLCCLWLYYVNYENPQKFYKLFAKLYTT